MAVRVARRAIWIFVAAILFWPVAAQAQVPHPIIPNGNWWRNCASLDMDFYNDRYYINHNTTCDGTTGTVYTAGSGNTGVQNFITGTGATFTRNSVATYFNSSGVLTTASANVPRLDHSPTGNYAPLGILIEESRQNYTTNNTMVGGSSPSTLPSNGWGLVGATGLTTTYAYGTENGISYIDFTLSGTATASGLAGLYQGSFVGTQGQMWTYSLYDKVSSGTTANVIGIYGRMDEKTSGCSTGLQSDLGSTVSIPVTALGTNRLVFTNTLANTSVGCVTPYFVISYNAGAINITVRIGMPQTEQGAFPTSVIPTSGTTVTRAADVFTLPTTAGGGSGWYSTGVGTLGANGIDPYQAGASGNGLVSIDNTTANNAIHAYVSTTQRKHEIYNGGSVVFGTAFNGYTPGTLTKSAIAFAANSANDAFDGAKYTAISSVSIPTVSQLEIGHGRPAATTYWNGWVNRIWYMPTRQPDYSLPDYTR